MARGRVGGVHGRARGRGRGGSVSGFLAPRNGRQAARVANAEAGAEYNPGIRESREQIAGSRKRQQDLGHWYARLARDFAGAQKAGAAALRSIEDTTTQQLAEAGQRSSADQARLGSEDAALASMIGGPRDTAGLSKIAQAGAAAQRARVALTLPTEQEQANFVANLGGQGAAARMQGIEARREEQQRRDKLRFDLTSQRKEKGAARVANTEKIREADRGYESELAKLRLARREARSAAEAAAAEAALAQLKAQREARQDAIGNRQAQERIGIERKNARTSARSQRATARHYRVENRGGLTPSERNSRREHSHDAMSAAKAQLAIKVPKNAKQWAQFEAALVEKLGSSYAAEAARAVAKLRKAQAARNRGGYERRIRRGEVAGPARP
jgi:hypothetical protein